MAWNLDGTALYYASRIFDRDLVESMPQELIERFTDALGYEMESIPAYSVVVYHVSAADGNTFAYFITADTHDVQQVYHLLLDGMSDPRQMTDATSDVLTLARIQDYSGLR